MFFSCNNPKTVILRVVPGAALSVLLATGNAHAGTVCVGTAGQLNTALIAAETNNESDDIRIRAGTYVAPIPDGFYYYPPSNDADVSNVTVSGGWNTDCSAATDDATLTVLSGNLQTPVLRFRNANGTITVRNLTITGGYADGGVVGALHFDHVSGFGIGVRVERVILHHNETYTALYVKTQATISVEGSLFHSNLTASTGAGGARIINENGFNATYIYNNTFAYNAVLSGSTVGGLLFENEDDAPTFIKNNIFWGNDNSDLGVVGNNANQNDCGYNDVGVFDDVIVCNGANVVQVDPGFTDPAGEDFRLATNSPLLDIGCNAVQCTGIPDIDLNGVARPQGAGWEMGAYEGGYGFSDLIFADDFD
jgi:hypothetical protein